MSMTTEQMMTDLLHSIGKDHRITPQTQPDFEDDGLRTAWLDNGRLIEVTIYPDQELYWSFKDPSATRVDFISRFGDEQTKQLAQRVRSNLILWEKGSIE